MKYKIYTLGCKVNEYESEVMADILENHGYTLDDNPDILVVNTCTVTNTADNKSRKLIRSLRKNYPKSLLIVVGCMIQNKKEAIDIDADIIIGNQNKTEIINYIKDYKNDTIVDIKDMDRANFEDMKLDNFDLTRAYIKIQDGCDNYCSYCIIPYVRGHVRCKKREDVLSEAKALVKNGHKEIVLTGIHTGNYHDGNYKFADLLNDLVKIEGLKRLRISSVEITELNEDVLDVIEKNNVLVDHMHIPLQSGSDEILKLMNRKYNTDYFIKKITKLKKIRPNISITTDVIVGFPGEEEKHFLETVNTIKKIGFTKIHVFPYSDREGTVASKMKNKVNGNIKKDRVKRLLALSKELEITNLHKNINRDIVFIPEVYRDGYLIGHTGDYLLIKAKGDEKYLSKEVLAKTKEVSYPYLISEVSVKQ
ncbi:MAG: tRNA (N(6)-L-threonylcarbamoyladenosine(37)-C(2))-methylthiotransferase MtaB [Bacilli bacterium]|nr:tRNA (N(6)-L-threonylcarbamoyladenosine(37)-C(2))-methylthiotransferase MtaB [Bacilli bacterium]